MVTRFGLVEVGGPCLQLAYAETDAGAQFPLQYHRGGTELAVMISGEGTIVTDDQKEYPFEGGDIVIVPADITYRVVNRGEGNCSRGFSSQKERNLFGVMVLPQTETSCAVVSKQRMTFQSAGEPFC